MAEPVLQTYEKNTPVTLLQNQFKNGDMLFMNWNTQRDGSGGAYGDKQRVGGGFASFETFLYAQWGYRLSVAVENGKGSLCAIYGNGAEVGFRATPDDGYKFTRWSDGVEQAEHPAVKMDRHRSYSTRCEPRQYKVTFNANGGTNPNPTSVSVTYGGTYGTLATVTPPAGYEFIGWYTSRDGGERIISSTKVTQTSDHSLYAQYKRTQISVWLDPGDMGTIEDNYRVRTVTVGQTYGDLPYPDISLPYWYFLHWYYKPDGQDKYYVYYDTIVTENKDHVLSAEYFYWKPDPPVVTKYKVTFDPNNSIDSSTEKEYESGASIGEFPVVQNPTGKTLVGWYTSKEGGTQYYTTTAVNGNVTLYARYGDKQAVELSVKWVSGIGKIGFTATATPTDAVISNTHGAGTGDGAEWKHPGTGNTDKINVVFTATKDGQSATVSCWAQYKTGTIQSETYEEVIAYDGTTVVNLDNLEPAQSIQPEGTRTLTITISKSPYHTDKVWHHVYFQTIGNEKTQYLAFADYGSNNIQHDYAKGVSTYMQMDTPIKTSLTVAITWQVYKGRDYYHSP